THPVPTQAFGRAEPIDPLAAGRPVVSRLVRPGAWLLGPCRSRAEEGSLPCLGLLQTGKVLPLDGAAGEPDDPDGPRTVAGRPEPAPPGAGLPAGRGLAVPPPGAPWGLPESAHGRRG